MCDEITPQKRVSGKALSFGSAVSVSFPLVRVYTREPGETGGTIRETVLGMAIIHQHDTLDPTPESLKEPLQFTNFRHAYCLTPEQVHHSAEWSEVTKMVYTIVHESNLAFVVRGTLSLRKPTLCRELSN